MLVCEVVLLDVLRSGLDRILEDVTHGDFLSAEKQRRNREDTASAAEVEHAVAGLHNSLEGLHDKLCGMVLSRAECGSRVYLKNTVAGSRGHVLP